MQSSVPESLQERKIALINIWYGTHEND